ncbi:MULTISPECIES: hypothetical protein [unclassified Microbacterium]|uniref:hypothetical protein n=1 Tax=unclassified Microbacterium TaxID=2609290 RepID=UPI00214C7029|nr:MULTISPECIES: hypothetical protein [unclassified Microbacterium]MCR2809192.1 hypothetical protein [Microbacterium sp. zg.B185]WIM20824.1 hypothetical protein QNO12_05935 [Microbacterium sp. zg-B185]
MLAVLAGLATGCQPQPEPTPTASVFASEEEAFAAAEETYRAYVDALNQVDLSDPETFEAVYEWTTGEANAGEKKSLTQMHADGWSVEGSTIVTAVEPRQYRGHADPTVTLETCTDVSAVMVTDSSGASVVDPNRPAAQPSLVRLDHSETTATGLVISSIDGGQQDC